MFNELNDGLYSKICKQPEKKEIGINYGSTGYEHKSLIKVKNNFYIDVVKNGKNNRPFAQLLTERKYNGPKDYLKKYRRVLPTLL